MSEKPTNGPWIRDTKYVEDWKIPLHRYDASSSCRSISNAAGVVVAFAVVSYDEFDDPSKESQLSRNADLIAEAGTVYHETGLTPRELADVFNRFTELAKLYERIDRTEGKFVAAEMRYALSAERKT